MKSNIVVTLALFLATAKALAEIRTFTSSAGTTLKGEFVSVVGDTVTIKKEDGTPLTLKLAAFSRVDQAWLRTQATSTPDPAKATKDAPFVNSLGMKFVLVPGTQVLMCIHETRRKDYASYALANNDVNSQWKKPKGYPKSMTLSDNHPVEETSWEDAQAFCAWLGRKEGMKYRLPTDREWSCAVGIGDLEQPEASPESLDAKLPDVYPWGTTWPPPVDAGNYYDQMCVALLKPKKTDQLAAMEGYLDGFGRNDSFAMVAPVMSFPPNSLGIYDLGGNIYEVCLDEFGPSTKDVVFRGSAWGFTGRGNMRSSGRVHQPKDVRIGGFRCVLELNATASGGGTAVTTPAPAVSTMPPKTGASSQAAAAKKEAPFINSLGMKFVPVKEVPVLFCIHETRRQDYAAFAGENPQTPGTWEAATYQGQPCGQQDDHPVVSVSWHEAQLFCAWLSAKEGLKYRLPTDEEWSAAVGLGSLEKREKDSTPESLNGVEKTFYPWGGTYPPTNRDKAGNYPDTALRAVMNFGLEDYTDGFAGTAPVMSYAANKSGIYDMGGNVWEWVDDMWNGYSTNRVIRGSGFGILGRPYLLASFRGNEAPDKRTSTIGFRVVLELPKS